MHTYLSALVLLPGAHGGFAAVGAASALNPSSPVNLLPDPTSYAAIGWLVLGLASLCVAINQIDDFFERRKPRTGFPPPEQLDNSQKALADRVTRLELALGEIRREMKEDREAQTKAGSIRAAGIYRKIDEVRQELTESQRSLPNEIVTLLKNTNAI